MYGNDDYLSHILGLVGSSPVAEAQRQGVAPQLPGELAEMQPSDPVTVPSLTTGGQSPGQSFGDKWALGFDGSSLPRPSGYQSTGDQFLTALLGQTLKSAAATRLRSIDERDATQKALALNTQRINEANADATRRYHAERLRTMDARHERRMAAADRASEREADYNRDHFTLTSAHLRAAGMPREMLGMPISNAEYGQFVRAKRANDRRDSFDPSGLSKADQQRLANLRERANRVNSRAMQFYQSSISANVREEDRKVAAARASELQATADQLFEQVDALLAKGQPKEPPPINRNGALPDFAPFNRSAPTPAAAASAPAAAPTAPAPAAKPASSAVGTPEQETNKALAAMLRAGTIKTAAEAAEYLDQNAAEVKRLGINRNVIMRAFGRP